jgi:hypothetical protein
LNTPPAVTWFPPDAWLTTVFAADSTAGRAGWRYQLPGRARWLLKAGGRSESRGNLGQSPPHDPWCRSRGVGLTPWHHSRRSCRLPLSGSLAGRSLMPPAGMSRPGGPKRSERTHYRTGQSARTRTSRTTHHCARRVGSALALWNINRTARRSLAAVITRYPPYLFVRASDHELAEDGADRVYLARRDRGG